MPSLTRPLSPGFRSVSFEDDSMFPYPTLLDDCVNNDHGDVQPVGSVQELRRMFLVHTTDSVKWGDAAVAAKRALIEPKVTSSNQELFRTYHPSLSHLSDVYLVEENENKWIWVVSPALATAQSISTHAGGLEIHLAPSGFAEQTTTMWPKFQQDPIGTLTPRKFLSRGHLHRLREMFPTSIGTRVFISGYIVILFKSRTDIEESWLQDGLADTFGALRIRYDILEDNPTQKVIAKGAEIAAKPGCVEAHAALGLKLRFPEGQEAITVPTHAFVALRGIRTSALRRIAELYYRFKQKLARCPSIKSGLSLPAIVSSWRQPMGNSPLGKQGFLAGGSEEIGTISFTYDPIAESPLRFPTGFTHDLSLISHSAKLPEVTSPYGTPCVVGWGSYKDFLDGQRVFVTGFNITTGNTIVRSGNGLSREAQVALAEGSQYLWDGELLSQNVSILWRTETDEGPIGGLSGSAVCLGEIQLAWRFVSRTLSHLFTPESC